MTKVRVTSAAGKLLDQFTTNCDDVAERRIRNILKFHPDATVEQNLENSSRTYERSTEI